MKIVCDACSAKYTIPDHKLKAKQNKVRCKKCGHTIVFSAESATAAPTPEVAPAEVVATPGAQWFAAVNNKETGPLTKEELFALIASGQVDQETLVWREGMADWIRLADVAELEDRPFTGSAAGIGALEEPPPAPAANATIALSGIDDLLPPESGFTGESPAVAAESEQPALGDSAVAEALATGLISTPAEPSAAPYASEPAASAAAPVFADFFAPASPSRLTGSGKMVAERSEDSVLFSLATLTQSTPAVKAGAAANDASGLIDIRVLASAAAPAASGRAPVASIAAPVIPLPPRKKNTGLVVGGAVAGAVVVAVAAVAVFVATRPTPPAEAPAPAAPVAAAPEAAPAPAPVPVPEVAPAAPAEPPAAPGSEVAVAEVQPGAPAAPRAERPSPGTPAPAAVAPAPAAAPEVVPAPVAQPAAPAPKAPDAAVAGVLNSLRGGVKPAAPVAAPAAPAAPEAAPAPAAPKGLTKDEVKSTIARYGSRIARCKTAENAGTTVKVSFSIEPSGSVSGASSADGGEAGSCLAGVVSGMKFKAFEGAALPITFPFKL